MSIATIQLLVNGRVLNSSVLPPRNGRAISAIDGKVYVAGGENSIGHSREKVFVSVRNCNR